MGLDALTLARLQFAFTVGFHYLFPPLSIGLSWMMVLVEGAYLRTGNKEYEAIARFWTSIFAVVFAVGVASGIVMEFQFGTNWARYSRFVGDVFGSALAAEGIFAFFLESGFLAVLVFGWDRVSSRMHFFSTCMVALGALFSSIWIVVANSWQQTPAGHHLVPILRGGQPVLVNGEPLMRAEIVDFWALVFNPSSVPRLLHVWTGAGVLGAFFVLSIASYYILKGQHAPLARKMFTLGLAMGLAMACLGVVTGHLQAIVVAGHQPAKLAAFEGHFETGEGGATSYVWGFPDQKARRVNYAIGIPRGLSLLVHLNPNKPVPGLDQFPEDEWPPVAMTFYSFHIMVMLGFAFPALMILTAFFWWRGTVYRQRWLLWILVFSVVLPFIANELGWVTAEVGRQPWIVYGLLRTAEGVSPAVDAGQILSSVIMFGVVYLLLFAVWILVMDRKIRKGPQVPVPGSGPARRDGFLDVAAEIGDPAGPSLTSAHDSRTDNGGANAREM